MQAAEIHLQSHRVIEVGCDLLISSCPKKHIQLEQVTQDHAQLDFKYLQG